jgi:hypothetical protein
MEQLVYIDAQCEAERTLLKAFSKYFQEQKKKKGTRIRIVDASLN